jgi:hypothetical protein
LFWHPLWDPWRDDPRFHQLLVKVGCTDDYRRAREELDRQKKEAAASK